MATQQPFMKVLVLGDTGRVGEHVAKQALNHGHSVTALIRNPEKLKSVPIHMTVIRGNVLDPESLSAAVDGQDALICAVGINSIGPTTPIQ